MSIIISYNTLQILHEIGIYFALETNNKQFHLMPKKLFQTFNTNPI